MFSERTFLETKSGNCYQIEFDKDWSINSITKRKCKTKTQFFSFKGHFHLWTHFGVKLLCWKWRGGNCQYLTWTFSEYCDIINKRDLISPLQPIVTKTIFCKILNNFVLLLRLLLIMHTSQTFSWKTLMQNTKWSSYFFLSPSHHKVENTNIGNITRRAVGQTLENCWYPDPGTWDSHCHTISTTLNIWTKIFEHFWWYAIFAWGLFRPETLSWNLS